MKGSSQRLIEVWADWIGLGKPVLMGTLSAATAKGKEVFSFEYDQSWLQLGMAQTLDPSLLLFGGAQYPKAGKSNFGIFLDSAPDRWGRFLMDRREAQLAREEKRPGRKLHESDYLLGVFDQHRMGALRFRLNPDEPFLDNNKEFASPPWTSLRELETAALALEKPGAEKDKSYKRWLAMLIAPGGSLGGARPKASVIGTDGHLWIAKFPSRNDSVDWGAWELIVHDLAKKSGIIVPEAMARSFNTKRHTFLTKRFDRTAKGARLHFASAMTLLNHNDGDGADSGVSYLELAELIIKEGARPNADLEQLWRRIVFSICVSNTDDHLRNHGFLLTQEGWVLSPAYDMNPVSKSDGLALNISKADNSLDLELALEVAPFFRVKEKRAKTIVKEISSVVRDWKILAKKMKLSSDEIEEMEPAFRFAHKEKVTK
jgi:serine/threonine-protein kinase HipA